MTSCPVCGSLPRPLFPLAGFPGGDNFFLQCQSCGHGMLAKHYAPAHSYLSGGTEYSRRGSDWFLSHVGGKFACALDFGCNDGYLLRQVRAGRLIGVDNATVSAGIECHAELDTVDAAPDLVISRHTLEHLPDPAATLKALVEKAAPHALFAIEVPCMDLLAESLRFDQIYNEHLQYFSVGSFRRMLNDCGLTERHLILHRHPHSMLAIAFKDHYRSMKWRPLELEPRFAAFKTWMLATGSAFMQSRRRFAYGASAIFPVLLYHLGIAPSQLEAVLDDDHAKVGLDFYGRCIHSPYDVSDATVLVTAPDSFAPILRKLGDARHVMPSVPLL